MYERKFDFPQGLKPNVSGAQCGTAEAVPFQITLMEPVLDAAQKPSIHEIR